MMHVHTWGKSTHAQNTDSVWPEWDRHREKGRWIGMASEHLHTLGQAQSATHCSGLPSVASGLPFLLTNPRAYLVLSLSFFLN